MVVEMLVFLQLFRCCLWMDLGLDNILQVFSSVFLSSVFGSLLLLFTTFSKFLSLEDDFGLFLANLGDKSLLRDGLLFLCL